MRRIFCLLTLVNISLISPFAQTESVNERKLDFDLGADFVNTFAWRGLLIDASPNLHGWAELSAGGFFTGIWSTANFTGTYAETDFNAGFSIGDFTATLTNYMSSQNDIFNFKRDESTHTGEIAVQYAISEDFPLQIFAGTLIYGSDFKLDSIGINAEPYFNEERNFSTYIELMYPVSVENVDLEFVLGGTTHKSHFYRSDNAAFINIGLKASKAINFTEKFELPISLQVYVNPEAESIYTVFKISF